MLKALYGVGTDVTVTKTPAAGSFTPGSFGFGFRTGTAQAARGGTKINTSTLGGTATLASISGSSVTTVAGLRDVAAAAGGLTLSDRTLSGTVPAINVNGGRWRRFRRRWRGLGAFHGPELPGQLHHHQLHRQRGGPERGRTRTAQLRQAQLRANLHRRGRLL